MRTVWFVLSTALVLGTAVLLAACGEDPTGLEPPEISPTPTITPWWTPLATRTPTHTPAPTGTPTRSPTPGPSWTPTRTPTQGPSPTATPTGQATWPPGAEGSWQGQTDTGGTVSFQIQGQMVVSFTAGIVVPCDEGGTCEYSADAFVLEKTGPNSFSASDWGGTWRFDGAVLSASEVVGVWSAPKPQGICTLFYEKTCGGAGIWGATR